MSKYYKKLMLLAKIRDVSSFTEITKVLPVERSMEQEDWTNFWKEIREENPIEDDRVECIILGTGRLLLEEEFEFIKKLLGKPTDEISNCCGEEIYPHNANDHTSRCYLCKEGCGVVYVWEGSSI